ncbi:bis(5'-nucleosyl)-tetraphosphatase (symmetrical) YqeK [Clostridiaceae bacterium 35-E11]
MHVEDIKHILQRKLTSKRYTHSLGVQQTAIMLAEIYHVSTEKASIAGLTHDCAKDLHDEELLKYARQFDILLDGVCKHQQQLLHGVIGAEIARSEFQIKDDSIINAIRYHTTGKENMNLLEKIIYIADYIEPNRDFPGVENLRKLALADIDKAILQAFDHTINYVIAKGELLHPLTISARNFLLVQLKVSRSE